MFSHPGGRDSGEDEPQAPATSARFAPIGSLSFPGVKRISLIPNHQCMLTDKKGKHLFYFACILSLSSSKSWFQSNFFPTKNTSIGSQTRTHYCCSLICGMCGFILSSECTPKYLPQDCAPEVLPGLSLALNRWLEASVDPRVVPNTAPLLTT